MKNRMEIKGETQRKCAVQTIQQANLDKALSGKAPVAPHRGPI